MEWPACSPLSFYVWDTLREHIADILIPPWAVRDMEIVLREECNGIPVFCVLENLIESIENRCATVIAVKMDYTSYKNTLSSSNKNPSSSSLTIDVKFDEMFFSVGH